jgi:hypothetical protein
MSAPLVSFESAFQQFKLNWTVNIERATGQGQTLVFSSLSLYIYIYIYIYIHKTDWSKDA